MHSIAVSLARHDLGRTSVIVDCDGDQCAVDIGIIADASNTQEAPAVAGWAGAIRDTGVWSVAESNFGDAFVASVRDVATRVAAARPSVTKAVTELSLEAPLPSPDSRIFALGGNFHQHMINFMRQLGVETTVEALDAERQGGQPPWGYSVVHGIVTGHGSPVTPPRGTTLLDYEAEFALVTQSAGRDLRADDLQFLGITAYSDFSIRDGAFKVGLPMDRGPLTWSLSKNFDTGKVLGPWLTLGEVDVDQVSMECRVNGQVRQRGFGSQLIYSIPETVSFLSRFMAIRPGDIFTSGCPAGAAAEDGRDGSKYLRPGDCVEVEISGVGTLRNDIMPWTLD